MTGIKHIVECHCVLPQYVGSKNPVYHKFVVFSTIDDSDTVIPKYAQCNNCGVVHKIIDICKSEIYAGKDELGALPNKDDISYSLPKHVLEVLQNYECSLPDYEHAKFICDHSRWGETLTLSKELLKDEVTGKFMVIKSDRVVIESFIDKVIV